jgi:hypothetical protein
MSFNIFAAGTEGFNYSRNNCADGGLFEAAAVMNALRAAGPTPVGVAEGVVDYYGPSVESEARSGIQAGLRMVFAQRLGQAVVMLAQCSGARQGWIAVSARKSATHRYARYNFMPNIDPGLEFMQSIMPALTATDMNNYGVLREMEIALMRYRNLIGAAARPMIQVELY